MARRGLLLAVLLLSGLGGDWALVEEICPNSCSGHGVCRPTVAGSCQCVPGFIGVDCSQRLCPAGRAWVDFPSANNVAHDDWTECSNMGICDRSTGLCSCYSGFSGAACEMSLCTVGITPDSNGTTTSRYQICSGRGRCLSLRQASLFQDFHTAFGGEEYSGWDADKVYGCVCDEGYEGPACQFRSCPLGDDPTTVAYPATQLIDCQCTTCLGTVQLSYRGQVAAPLPYDAMPALVQSRLRTLKGLENVQVKAILGEELCSSDGSVLQVTFPRLKQPSALSIVAATGLRTSYLAVRTGGFSSQILPSAKSYLAAGIEQAVCSNHGICDTSSGTCACFNGFSSSDGLGGPGNRGDCGYISAVSITCPYRNGEICSGHGSCYSAWGICQCDNGYDGPDCSRQACGWAQKWFGTDISQGHQGSAVCANVGVCDVSSGLCGSCGIFGGDSCEYLACPVDSLSRPCGGNGTCLTLRQLASYSYRDDGVLRDIAYDLWDADMVQGCACARAISVDNQYNMALSSSSFLANVTLVASANMLNLSRIATSYEEISRYYRGPYAFSATDFVGFDCSQMRCPTGDDPRTYGVNDVQVLHCTATSSDISQGETLSLLFRENVSLPVAVNASLSDLSTALEATFTISALHIWATASGPDDVALTNATFCSPTANISIFVEFLGQHGDLPLLSLATASSPSIALRVDKVQSGTTEEVECSRTGLCDYSTGRCRCLQGFQSSNGYGGPGETGDCSFSSPFTASSSYAVVPPR
eukprot:gene5706-6290_t